MDADSTNGQVDGETPPEPGFKKTKVGWIPEEWRVRKLGQVIKDISAGYSANCEDRKIEEGEVGVLKVSAVSYGTFDPSAHKAVIPEERELTKLPPQAGTLIMSRSNSEELVGKSVFVPQDYPNLRIPDTLWQVEVEDNISARWLNFALGSDRMRASIQSTATGTSGSMKKLSMKRLRSLKIAIPPFGEQRKIARILSTWNRAIKQVDNLIAAKERRKKALMQQLLKGETRVPGYGEDEWVKVKIGDLLKRVKRYVDWDDDAQYDLVSVKRGSEGLYHRKSIYGREKKTKKLHTLKEGDFVISRMQVVHGATAYVTPEFEGMHVSNSYIILRPREEANIDTEFFAWLAKMPYMYHLAYLASHGVHIEKMTFKPKFYFKSEVKIPPTVEEQQEIVSILKTCEQEIETLRDERAALRRQKRGMMQKLLTGKIRVSTEPTSPQVEA